MDISGFMTQLALEWGVQIVITFVSIYYFNKLNRKYPDFRLVRAARRLALRLKCRPTHDDVTVVGVEQIGPGSEGSIVYRENWGFSSEASLAETVERLENELSELHEARHLLQCKLAETARELSHLRETMRENHGRPKGNRQADSLRVSHLVHS